jgi:hypothetical protein
MIPTINETILNVSGQTELSILIKATLMLTVGLSCAVFTRRNTSSVRHLLLAATFAAIITLPLVVVAVP